jgi:hypothetical protein
MRSIERERENSLVFFLPYYSVIWPELVKENKMSTCFFWPELTFSFTWFLFILQIKRTKTITVITLVAAYR